MVPVRGIPLLNLEMPRAVPLLDRMDQIDHQVRKKEEETMKSHEFDMMIHTPLVPVLYI